MVHIFCLQFKDCLEAETSTDIKCFFSTRKLYRWTEVFTTLLLNTLWILWVSFYHFYLRFDQNIWSTVLFLWDFRCFFHRFPSILTTGFVWGCFKVKVSSTFSTSKTSLGLSNKFSTKKVVGGNSNIFIFTRSLGKIPILTNIFQLRYRLWPEWTF